MSTKAKEKKRIHLICNAHIDPVWLWNWEEGAAAAISTFRSAVHFCKEYDEFVFNHNEAVLYKWIEEYDPELFKEIQQLVKEGRWHIIGGWYLQPDCNMPCGESFVRQIEEGRRYFMEKFGVDGGKTAINFDAFGHTIGLVQILKDAGYENYIATRPAKLIYDGDDLHHKHIKWVGYNNKTINIFKGISYVTRLGEFINRYENLINPQMEKEDIIVLWGVGNHGGGPSKKDLDDIRNIMEQSEHEVVHSSPDEFFDNFKKRNEHDILLKKSLHSFSVGCYTSMIKVKQKHRQLENKLLMCEKMQSHARINGLLDKYEHDMMHEAWQDLLFCQFHDSLPGTSIQIVEEDILRRLDHGLEIAEKLIYRSYFRMIRGQKAPKEGEYPILVYNPHPFNVKTELECDYMWAESNRVPGTYAKGDVYDEKGNKVLCQNEKENSNVPLDWAKKVIFEAELEPMSMNRFNMVKTVVDKKPFIEPHSDDNYIYFDNGNMKVSVNKKTGLIDSYSIDDKEYVKPGACKLLVIDDNCDSWGMTVSSYPKVKGSFKLANPKQSAVICGVDVNELPPVRIIESSEVRMVVEASFVYSRSSCNVKYTFNYKNDEIGVNIRVFSLDKNVMYKLSIPTVFKGSKCIGKTAYGRDNLMTNGNENVSQQWVMLTTKQDALGVINTSNYGSGTKGGELRISVMRTPGYSAHPYEDRQILPLDRLSPRIDMGERLFDFWLIAGKYDDVNENIDASALVKHQKPVVINLTPSTNGERIKPFCLVDNKSVELVTVREKETKDGYSVRLFNSLNKKNTFTVTFPIFGYDKQFTLKPFEILTLDCNEKGVKKTKLV